ncbi:MAG TPA: lipopolysaccharide biosynthesis protein [Usitatibacter sp.]|nr:lipopolysaccharide biosynthesis protein [Usitatibacter sp.]
MNAVTASLERRALSLGTANAIDFALQFALPIVLTRTLDAHAFGEYRLLWLAVSTLMLVTPMCMAPALYYFLPRSDAPTQRLYINQTMVFLVGAGLVSAWALSLLNPFLPGKIHGILENNATVVPLFVLVWVFASILDVLPTAEERVSWQAKVVVSLAAVRAVALSAAAIVTRELGPVLWVLLAFALLKAALVISYVARHHGIRGPVARKETFGAQVKQAAPFALSGTLHGIRSQADQWIVAALFTVTQFASFSVATVLGPIVQVFRQSVNHVFLPSMSRLQSEGDFKAMLALNSRANGMVALLVYPLLAFAFIFAEDVIALVYTRTYLDAAPVLRLYVVALVAFVVELVSVLFVLKQGNFAARVNGLVLLVALPLSLYGAMNWGLVGAAAGSVAAIYTERFLSLGKIARLTATPISKLQDWDTLGCILGAAALSAGIAGLLLQWAPWSSFARLVSAALVVAITYPAALLLFGQGAQMTAFVSSLRNKAPA